MYLDNEIGYAGYRISVGEGGELWHARFRDYLPDVGAWTRRDPIGYAGRNRPLSVRATDPLGQWHGVWGI